ncbi:MAG: GumC family protein [Alphaproteobacteria bacterium]
MSPLEHHHDDFAKARYDTQAEDAHSDMDIDVRGLLLMLWRRKVIIVTIVVIGYALSFFMVSNITPKFTARALILIEVAANQKNPLKIEALNATMRDDKSFIYSEVEVIKSRTMAARVVDRLNLMSDPEFNPDYAAYKAADKAGNGMSAFKTLSVGAERLQMQDNALARLKTEQIISNYLGRLRVFSVGASNAIQIEYVSRNPLKAALIANTVADIYIEERLNEKFEATKRMTSWLDKRLEDLRGQVRGAEQAVVDYKAEFDITEGTRTITSAEELSQLNAKLVSAKSQLAEARARLAQVDRAILAGGSAIDSVSEVVSSSLIQQLKRQEAALEGRLSDLSTRYGHKHPQIIKLKSEIAELERNKAAEMVRVADTVANEVRFAEARVEALSEGLDESKGQRLDDGAAMIRLRELEREAESTRLIYDTFLQTYKRSDAQEELQKAEARVLSYASPPTKASYPNVPLMLSLSGVISLFIALAIVVLLEKLDNTYRSVNQLEKQLKFPCFAMIPRVYIKGQREIVNHVLSRPSSMVAESVRSLRTVLKLRARSAAGSPRVVNMTSSFPGDGKTTISVWLSRLSAKSDEKVILIDADLRRPNVHRCLGVSNDVSLVDYLTDDKSLDEVIQKDEKSGLHMILGRSVPNSALDLVSSKRMAKMIEQLRQVYDLIIIDAPASMAVSDSRILANLSDHTLYVVGWDKTPREVVMSGVKQFTDMDYRNLAFVLNNVDVKKHSDYGYSDDVHYHRESAKYYSE